MEDNQLDVGYLDKFLNLLMHSLDFVKLLDILDLVPQNLILDVEDMKDPVLDLLMLGFKEADHLMKLQTLEDFHGF